MNEVITINEVNNDGKSIYLYFNGLIGLYAAYGFSAYLLSKVTEVKVSYSENMQMPVVVINSEHLDEVKKKLKVKTEKQGFCYLEALEQIDENAYSDWAVEVRGGQFLI